jgi:Domain of unknown function (DUF4933)
VRREKDSFANFAVNGFKNNNMKKNISIHILIFFLLLIDISCHHNRLKTNEKELAKEILIQENEKKEAEKTALEKESSETRTSTTGSFRKKEIRSVDPQRPPIKIDIMGTLNNIRKLKLSDVASSIRYVKLQTPPDTLLLFDNFFYRNELMSTIRSDGEQIVFQGIFGVTRFNMQGEYQETIWKNKSGIKFYDKSVLFGGQDFSGVLPNIPVSILNGDLYAYFHDGPGKKGLVMKYKLNTGKNISFQHQTEVPGSGHFPGDTLLNTKKQWWEGFNQIYGTGHDNWAGVNGKWQAGKSGSLLVTYNDKGDTLCQFTDYDRIVNFTHTDYRTPVELSNYYFDGLLTFKQEYNDTVFRLIPPDRLFPVYIIDFGDFRVNYIDGLNPDFDLSGKFLLKSLHETNNYLFIRYTQYYDAPAIRKKNAVKFYNAIFDKKEDKLYHQPGFTPLPNGLENDLDGGMPFWPDFITPQGEMMKLVSGQILKDFINSEVFKEAKISGNDRQKQIIMASGLKPTDMIIVIVK